MNTMHKYHKNIPKVCYVYFCLFLVVIFQLNLTAQQTPLQISGNINLASQYSLGNSTKNSFQPKPFDYTSNSRLSLQYGLSRFTVILNKPLTLFRYGQPDKYYTLEYSNAWITARYGDLMPQFTQSTTGYARVAGVEGKLNLFRFIEINSVYGVSKLASPTQGYMMGSYRQNFLGGRIKFLPTSSINLGISAVKIKDDINSQDFSGSFSKMLANDNFILGSDLSIFFLNRRANLTVEYAASYFNSDQTAPSNGEIITDSKTLNWLTDRKTAQNFVTFNDSTRSGEVITARLVLPISTSRFTLEYRRATKSYVSLAMPYEQSDNERYRLSNNTTLFSGFISFMLNGDYNRSNISKTQLFTTHYANVFTNLSVNPKNFPRITIGWRQNERFNDAPLPVPKKWDRRVKTSMKSANLSVSRDIGLWMIPMTITGTITGNWYKDKIRNTSDYNWYSAQLYTQTLPPSRISWNAQFGYSFNQRTLSKIQRHNFQFLIKEGYDVVFDKLNIYAIEGINIERTSDNQQRTNNFSWGAGARWMPKPGTSVEFEWQYNIYRNFIYTEYNYGRQFFELRINYGI